MKRCSLGVDEAGYGPLLGPLVVGLAGFDSPRPTLGEGALLVGDSKKLLSRRRGLARVEAAVLAMSEASGQGASSLGEWLNNVADGVVDDLMVSEWFQELDLNLPLFANETEMSHARDCVAGDVQHGGGAFRGFLLHVVSARSFNERVGQNKHTFLAGLVTDLLDRAREEQGECEFFVDRLGGRAHYEPLLSGSFPFMPVTVMEENRRHSSYRIGFSPHEATISFEVGSDGRHFEVALASMAAKYAREALMHAFNRYWAARVPGIRPTRGYYTDGLRFLADLEARDALAGFDRAHLVRTR